ncbi:cilia- and flagella-associated protein 45 isoform X2 [Physcomitrium patens]|uniref:cilia- and flagella-associated protein 45 isoform X2 n=1 Tax=Physcomitrium patens TaxID=3218 RepID=UPI003CCDC4FB
MEKLEAKSTMKGLKHEANCTPQVMSKKPLQPSPENTHNQCKEEYMKSFYCHLGTKNKHPGSIDTMVSQTPTSNVHHNCVSEYQSEKSNASRRYTLLSRTSDVEEELFGNKGSHGNKTQRSIKKHEERKPIMDENKDTLCKENNVVVINSNDIDLIKKKAIIVTQAVIEEQKRQKEALLAERNVKANQRKALMIKLEAERKKKSGPMSDSEVLKKQEDALTLEEAKRAIEEREDDVKLMNSIMSYSKCVTQRDAQKNDRINREKEEKEYNQKWHVIMEAARHKLIDFYENEEEKKKIDRRAGAAIHNEIQKQIAAEQKLQEGLKLQREFKNIMEEEEKKAEAKRLEGVALLKYIVDQNKEEEKVKRKMKEREIIEEEKRNAYIFAKDQREQAYKEEQERIQKQKEIEASRIRVAQERASGASAALEDLRNQRIFEAHEKAWREKEAADAEKMRRMNAELHFAREQQKFLKAKEIADQAIAVEQEYYKILKLQKEGIELEKKEEERLHEARMKNLFHLKEQMKEREEATKATAREKILEGEHLKQAKRVEKLKLAKIKERKLDELIKCGVPQKYQVDLIKLKVGIP